jgi:hypothetical protein
MLASYFIRGVIFDIAALIVKYAVLIVYRLANCPDENLC